MDKTELSKYIRNPESLSEKTINGVIRLKEDFPFFQTAYLLAIKNLQNIGSSDFDKNLHLSAAYVTDRRILYDLLYNQIPLPLPIKGDKKVTSSNRIIKDNLKDNISDTLTSQLQNFESGDHEQMELIPEVAIDVRKEYGEGIELDEIKLNLKPFGIDMPETHTYDTVENVPDEKAAISNVEINTEKEILEIEVQETGMSLESPDNVSLDISEVFEAVQDENRFQEEKIEFDMIEKDSLFQEPENVEAAKEPVLNSDSFEQTEEQHTFTDWLKSVESGDNYIPTVSNESEYRKEKKISNTELIDNFISSEPKKIKPLVEKEEIFDISEHSIQEHEGFITDTLAKIYIKQGYYSKAIFAYEKLILKYPEKSSYFAGQIEEIKKIIKIL